MLLIVRQWLSVVIQQQKMLLLARYSVKKKKKSLLKKTDGGKHTEKSKYKKVEFPYTLRISDP